MSRQPSSATTSQLTITPELASKVQGVSALLKAYTPPEAEVFPSKPTGYRMRAEFRVWHDDDDLYYVMFPKGAPDQPYRVDQLDVASAPINQLMPILLDAIKKVTELRHRLFQIDFLSNQAGECLVSLLYHRALTDEWEVPARQLQDELGINIIGRSRRQKRVLDKDFIIERFQLDDRYYDYQQIENSFTQPNASINAKMLAWASDCSQALPNDLLELYCGNGNFSIALSPQFDKVLATEVSKSSIRSARYNCELNQVSNVTFVRLSAAEVSEALSAKREFRRLKEIDLKSYQFSTVLVDPPRAGLDAEALAFIQNFDNIIYISCNPNTLAENLEQLTQSHTIKRFAVFDQFPQTEHIESGVLLTKKP